MFFWPNRSLTGGSPLRCCDSSLDQLAGQPVLSGCKLLTLIQSDSSGNFNTKYWFNLDQYSSCWNLRRRTLWHNGLGPFCLEFWGCSSCVYVCSAPTLQISNSPKNVHIVWLAHLLQIWWFLSDGTTPAAITAITLLLLIKVTPYTLYLSCCTYEVYSTVTV